MFCIWDRIANANLPFPLECIAVLYCCLIEVLIFTGNNRLTDASVKMLAKSCPMLEHVYLVDCPRITDLALKALASSKHISVFNVADCVR